MISEGIFNFLMPTLKKCENSFHIRGRSQTIRLQDEVGPKMFTFCQCSYHRKCHCREGGGQEKPKVLST